MDVLSQHRRAREYFGRLVDAISEGQWCEPTPCAGWDVRQIVNHVVGENRWAVHLYKGETVGDVGTALDGDVLGEDPKVAWHRSADEATASVTAPGAMGAVVHLSFGDFTGEEYARQLVADLLIHGWDLARAIGGEETLDPELVASVTGWFAAWEDGYRSAGAIGPRSIADGTDPSETLLAAFGRNPSPDDTLSVVRRFNAAFGRHDVDAVMALMTDDCVFEDTTPPVGRRHEGQAAVRAVWTELFASKPRFTTEEAVICGDRGTYRWRYDFDGGSVRGIDLFRVADGKVAEKLAYVKG